MEIIVLIIVLTGFAAGVVYSFVRIVRILLDKNL